MTHSVLVTGATGFLAQHCIVALLEAGYLVRGTARRADSEDRIRENLRPHLSPQACERLEQFRVVAADLRADAGFREAADGCTYVLHVASPLPARPPREDREVIEPARDGALRVLRAAHAAGVRRVVMTSSIAAIVNRAEVGRRFTEEDWSAICRARTRPRTRNPSTSPNVPRGTSSRACRRNVAWSSWSSIRV